MRLLAAAIAIATLSAAPAAAQKNVKTAEAFLKSIYKNYGKGGPGSKLSQPERYFEPALARAIRADQKAADARGDISKMDADPFCDCQDFEGMAPMEIGQIMIDIHKPRADADVSFGFPDTRVRIDFELAWDGRKWRIRDIAYDDGRRLRNVYFPPQD